jgi:hypothetical protein
LRVISNGVVGEITPVAQRGALLAIGTIGRAFGALRDGQRRREGGNARRQVKQT